MHRLQHDTEGVELAQCCRHGVFIIAAPQLRRLARAKDQPALPYNWASGRDMLFTSTLSNAKQMGRGADYSSWVSSFLWAPSQNSAMMLSHQMICIQT